MGVSVAAGASAVGAAPKGSVQAVSKNIQGRRLRRFITPRKSD
jgi:hypothetical protein